MSSFSENGRRRSGALTPQVMNIPLFVGEDTSVDPRVLQPGQNALVENGRLFNRGQVQKRFGYQSIPRATTNGSVPTVGAQVFSAGTALFHSDYANLRTYSPANTIWQSLGRKAGGRLTGAGVVQSNANVTESSSAATAAFTCVAWAESGAIYVSVVENGTGVQVMPRLQVIAAGQSPNVITFGGDFYVFYAVGGGSVAFFVHAIRASSPGSISPQHGVPAAPGFGTLFYDVQARATDAIGIFNDFRNVIGGIYNTIVSMDATMTFTVLANLTNSPLVTPLPSIGSLGGSHYLYYDGRYLNSDTHGPLTTPFKPGRIGISPSGYHFAEIIVNTLAGGIAQTTIGIQVFYADTTTPAVVTAIGNPVWASETTPGNGTMTGLRLASQPFTYAGTTYCWAVADSLLGSGAPSQSQWFLIDQTGAIVGNALNNGLAAGYDTIGVSLAHPTDNGSGVFSFAARYVQQVRSAATGMAFPAGVLLRALDMSAPRTYAHYVDGVTYMSGPSPQIYDGATMTEWGFFNYPAFSAQRSPGGGSLAGGAYLLYAVYGWYDATGKLWRSGPSIPVTLTGLNPNDGISISVNYLQTSAKQNVFIEIYCTANVGGQTGVAPFKVVSLPNIPTPFPAGTNYNNPSLAPPNTQASYTITVSDAVINTGEPLYINGGLPSNITPPPINHLSASGIRLYGTAAELSQVYVTSPAGPGSPLNMFASQAISVPTTDSAINATAVMDGRMFISTQRSWYVTNADTSANVQTITFTPIRKLAFDTGVSAPASVFTTLDGVYFQGQRGLALLARNESLIFIGEVVKNYSEAVVDAYIVPQQEQLRFVQGPRILAYDYQQKGWSQHVFAAVPGIVSACRWNDVGVILRPDGTAMVEVPGVFKDDSLAVTRRIETPWIRPGQMGGWGRVWRFLILGERRSAHTLQVKIAYEDDPSYIDTLTISSESVYGQPAFGGGLGTFGRLLPLGVGNPYGANGAGNAYKFEGIMPRSKAGSFKFEISEINSTGEDSALNYLSLLYGVLPNIGQVPTGKKFG